jgi:hypothetical protein
MCQENLPFISVLRGAMRHRRLASTLSELSVGSRIFLDAVCKTHCRQSDQANARLPVSGLSQLPKEVALRGQGVLRLK